ncbi:MAG: phosphate acyltransferase PlsX [Verrucomicrobiota bacterium]|nr:phosphate acyltransferase PlsX [Verrucomicrobiota bacterium]
MRIALDAMGGDKGLETNVEGAGIALEALPCLKQLYLVGDKEKIENAINKYSINIEKIEIAHASEIVEMHESPANAIRRKKDSSISVATDLVKNGTCEAIVSAGNTGAAVTAATLKLRNLNGIDRAGIASPIPNEYGMSYLLDAGANPEAKPQHLLQYAVMGSVYSSYVHGKESPKIGLMSNGAEEEKGTTFTKEVFGLLKESNLNFIGNIEGHDLFSKEVDVVVCDGFTGNIILKTCEATAKAVAKWVSEEIQKNTLGKIGGALVKPAFKAAMARGSYEEYGGSPLLGTNGICIIAHGGSSPLAIKNAIRVASESVTQRINPHIEEEIAKLSFP